MRRKTTRRSKRPAKRAGPRRLTRKGRRIHQKGLSDVVRAGAYGATAMAAYYGNKRGSATKTLVRKRKIVRDKNSYQQWEQFRYKRRFGRVTQRKINGLSMDSTVFFWRSLNNIDTGFGRLKMHNWYDPANAALGAAVPVYLIELNSCNNAQNGVIATHSPVYTAVRASGPAYTWSSVSGLLSDGVTADTQWQVERASLTAASGNNYPLQSSIISWADVRFDLFGCTAQPTKFVIELCQFDDECVPVVGTITDNNHVRFWDAQVRSFISNPNLHQISYGNKNYKKVLDRRVIEIGPTSTTESDTDPHIKTVQLFYRLNRRCNYSWKDYIAAPAENATNAQLPTVMVPQSFGDSSVQVHPRARLFVMIRAVKFVRDLNAGAETNASTPSFNVQVRTKHMVGS